MQGWEENTYAHVVKEHLLIQGVLSAFTHKPEPTSYYVLTGKVMHSKVI